MTVRDQRNRAARYARISFDKADDEHGVTNQLADQQRAADARGYDVVLTERDNDISALTGQHRPGYERVMAAAARGEIDVIIVFQLSRFWRNRRERAEGIEILRKAGVSIVATRGPSLDMSTAYGRAMAGLLGEFDTMESEVKSERQQLANESAANEGKPRKATSRPFGWLEDRATADPAESAAIRDACHAILAGGTVSGIARDWGDRGLRPPQVPFGPLPERAWSRTSVRKILTSPRVAGLSFYRLRENGENITAAGQWEALVLEETWRAVCGILRAEGRRPTQGVTTLLGGIAMCRCGNYITGGQSGKGLPSYRCNQATRNGRPGPHVSVKRDGVDEAISALVVARLSEPDIAEFLMPPQAKGGARALREEEAALLSRLSRLGELYAAGEISETDLTGGRRRGQKRLGEIAASLASLGRESAVAPFIASRNAAATWKSYGTDRRRAVVDALMTVTLHPSARGARTFDLEKVLPPGRGIKWKGAAG